MSGGGSTPTAPTIAGVGQANQNFGTATSNAAQTMNTAQAYNQNAQNQLNTTLGTSNQNAALLGQGAQSNLNQYQQTFQPLQAQQAKEAQAYGSQANLQNLAGQAVGASNAGTQAGIQNQRAALAAEGVDPASIGGGASQNAANVMGAAAAGQAGTQAAIQGQQQAFQMANQTNALGLGVGQQGSGQAATGAQVAQGAQQSANQTNATGVQNLTAANQYLNTANQSAQTGIQGQQAQFQDQMAVYNAQQQQQAGVGQMVGDVAGIAAMAMMEGGGPVPQGIPTYAAGGTAMANPFVRGGMVNGRGALPTSPIRGSTDTKPALLTPGEFVMPKDVVDFKGADFFHKQIDSIRNAKNKRMAIPIHHPPHVSFH